MSSLLPPNALDQERALEASTARIGDVHVPIKNLWNPDTCPVDLLPWLAWSMSLDTWQPYWPESIKRERIRRAVQIQSIKGTVKSVRDVVKSFGANLSIKEWWQNSPRTTPHTFSVVLSVGAGAPPTPQYQQDIITAVRRTKPVRSHFDFAVAQSASGGIGLAGLMRGCIYRRLALRERPATGAVLLAGGVKSVTYRRL